MASGFTTLPCILELTPTSGPPSLIDFLSPPGAYPGNTFIP
jgi:hypothetical protein